MSPKQIIRRAIAKTLSSYGSFGSASIERIREIAAPTPAERMTQNWNTVGKDLQTAINHFGQNYVKKTKDKSAKCPTKA